MDAGGAFGGSVMIIPPEHQTTEFRAIWAANRLAVAVWGKYGGGQSSPWYPKVLDWQERINVHNRNGGRVLALPDPLDGFGLDDACRAQIHAAVATGASLGAITAKLRKYRKAGLLKGVQGVYITNERNSVRAKNGKTYIYHRVRMNICGGGKRYRRQLSQHRVA